MSKLFMSIPFILLALLLNDSVASACPDSNLVIHDVTISAEGVVTRKVTVKKSSDAQRPGAPDKYVSVVRDSVKLERGDELNLNAGINYVDASVSVKLSLESQSRDEKGIFSSTFLIQETMISSLAGPQEPVVKNFTAKLTSNYAGNGTYSKGCGEVVLSDF